MCLCLFLWSIDLAIVQRNKDIRTLFKVRTVYESSQYEAQSVAEPRIHHSNVGLRKIMSGVARSDARAQDSTADIASSLQRAPHPKHRTHVI